MSVVDTIKSKYKKLPYKYRVNLSKVIWYARKTDSLVYKIKQKVGRHSQRIKVSNMDGLCIRPSTPSMYDEWNVSGDLTQINNCFKNASSDSYLIFPVIDWHFRIQRPQHLARELGALGNKVIYFTTTFNVSQTPGFKVVESPEKNVVVCQLNINKKNISIYRDKLNNNDITFLLKSVSAVRATFDLEHTNSLINLPFWTDVADGLSGNTIIYDCMDHHAGFENNSEEMLNEEHKLLERSDLVITTAEKLSTIISEKKENIIIRNAAEVEFFSKIDERNFFNKKRKTVGYYGAIAEWFDLDLLKNCAQATPEYDYLIVGNVTVDLNGLEQMDNVYFVGEVPYSELPGYLNSMDVCLIPFQLIELTLCTNPVKVYEYLAAGKPVVSTPLPEVELMAEYVHIGKSTDDFVNKLHLAFEEVDDSELRNKRQSWALTQDWSSRARGLVSAVNDLRVFSKKVSLVVLTYNNIDLTKECLRSIEQNTYYLNYEVIIVDNCSSDGTQQFLLNNYSKKEKFKVVLNDENLGFAAGNNIGLMQATGDILIVINNDTYVSPYWLSSIVSTFERHRDIGLACPRTNNIGNEAKINVEYSNFNDMHIVASNICIENRQAIYPVDNIAFFCAIFRREMFDSVGLISEDYGRGFFEDDDYCQRVKKSGWNIAVIDDSFVHHHLSASFNKLKDDGKEKLMIQNRAIYESKWGEWKPHTYRPGVY